MKRPKPIPLTSQETPTLHPPHPPRKLKHIEIAQTEDQTTYPIIKYSNMQLNSQTKQYLNSRLAINRYQIGDKSEAVMSLVPYDPRVHFAPWCGYVGGELGELGEMGCDNQMSVQDGMDGNMEYFMDFE